MTASTRGCIALILSMLLHGGSGHAQDLLLHLPFDGTLDFSGSTGSPKFMAEDAQAAPVFVTGHIGQALLLDGAVSVGAAFNLDHAQYPQVTVTAWVREESGASGSRDILSSGSTAGARVGVHGGRLTARLGNRGVSFAGSDFPQNQWVFVAAVLDTAAGRAELHQDEDVYVRDGLEVSTREPRLYVDPTDPASEPQQWVIVGAENFETFAATTRPMQVDEVRLYAGALSAERLAELRAAAADPDAAATTIPADVDGTGAAAAIPIGATGEGSLAGSDLPAASCNSHADCPTGQYCAFERICHPDRHAPMRDLQSGYVVPLETLPAAAGSDAPVAGSGSPVPVGDAVATAVTGETSKVTHEMDLGDRFLTYVSWWENEDRPCGIAISGSENPEGGLAKEFYDCNSMLGGNLLPSSAGVVVLPGMGMTEDFAGRGAGAIQVCSNTNSNRRMKGLRLAGNWIGRDGSIQGSDLEDSYELSHCREWRSTVACGVDRLATGIVVHVTRATRYNEQIVGLQLLCRKVGLSEG